MHGEKDRRYRRRKYHRCFKAFEIFFRFYIHTNPKVHFVSTNNHSLILWFRWVCILRAALEVNNFPHSIQGNWLSTCWPSMCSLRLFFDLTSLLQIVHCQRYTPNADTTVLMWSSRASSSKHVLRFRWKYFRLLKFFN